MQLAVRFALRAEARSAQALFQRCTGAGRRGGGWYPDARSFGAVVSPGAGTGSHELGSRLPAEEELWKSQAATKAATNPEEKWKQITVEMWRDAVYTNRTYFGELIDDTSEFIKVLAEQIKLGGRRVSFLEVGCGTGEFVRAVKDDFRTAVGVDFNKEFIDYCKEHTEERDAKRVRYVEGDATRLNDLMREQFSPIAQAGSRGVEFWDDARIVACVGNTIGIIPQDLRPQVYEQMAELAGKDGVLVMVYWNAKWFGDACLNFYHANPKLCGEFEGSGVDFKNTTLVTPMGYQTKWTSVDEARQVMEDLGLEIISLREKGKGVFVAARRF